MRTIGLIAGCLAATLLIASCGGGGGSPAVNPPPDNGDPPPPDNGDPPPPDNGDPPPPDNGDPPPPDNGDPPPPDNGDPPPPDNGDPPPPDNGDPPPPDNGDPPPPDNGDPPPPDNGNDVTWLFSGTVASEQARTEGGAALKEILSSAVGVGYSCCSFNLRSTGHEHERSLDGPLNFLDLQAPAIPRDYQYIKWGHWNLLASESLHPLRGYQVSSKTATNAETYRAHGITDENIIDATAERTKHAVVVMEHGYFGIGHRRRGQALRYGQPIDLERYWGTSAYYTTDDSLNLDGRSLSSLDLTGALYAGDALAIERASQAGTAHTGTAELLITDADPITIAQGHDYSLSLNINLGNGAHFLLTGSAGYRGDFVGERTAIFVADEGDSTDPTASARGEITGPNAEAAFGAFHTPDYFGSFGMTRQGRLRN